MIIDLKTLSDKEFLRSTGVTKPVFLRLLEIMKEAEIKKKKFGGRRNTKVNIEDKLNMALEYWRHYTTQAKIGQQYGISDSYCKKCITFVENTLAKHPDLALPSKDVLVDGDYDSVAIDATESPIERPKKREKMLFPEKKTTYLKKSNNS